MKIVMVEDFFHPDAGYQLNVLCKYLVKFGHEVTILTGELDKFPHYLTDFFGRDHIEARDREYEAAFGVRICRMPVRRFVSGRAFFDNSALFAAIRGEKPDVLFVHGNDTVTGMWAIRNRKKFGCPLVLDSHMVDMASVNPLRKEFYWFYRRFVTPAVRRDGLTVIRTQDDDFVQRRLGVPLSQAPYISLGSDTMLFHPDTETRAAFRSAHAVPQDAFVVVYAGKLDEYKGGKLLAELTASRLDVAREAVYLVVGDSVGDYGAEVENIFARSPYRVLRFPTQKYRDLAPFYQAADLAVFPKQCSLSFYDVQACGLPVLFEDNNINLERCSHDNGWVFRGGDAEDFAHKLTEIVNMPPAAFAAVGKNAAAFIQREYDYEEKARAYERILIETARRGIHKI